MNYLENLPNLIHLSFHKILIGKGKENPIHIHHGYEIYVYVSGAQSFWINNKTYQISSGDIFIIPPLAAHRLILNPDTIYERYILHVNPKFLSILEQELQINMNISLFLKQFEMERRYLFSLTPEESKRILSCCEEAKQTITRAHQNIKDSSMIQMVSIACSMNIFALILDKLTNQFHPAFNFQMLDPIMTQALDYIDQHTQDACRVKDLADALYISKTTLYKKFQLFFNCSPKQYILYQKIQVAKLFLSQGLNIKTTAERCGFNDYTNFIKAFTNETGMTPKKYKKLKE